MATSSPAPKTNVQTANLLHKWESQLHRVAPFGSFALILLFAVWAWLASHKTKFQFDELLEMSAVTAPSNRDLLAFLASGVDFNPPLSHFLIRIGINVLGTSEWTARLPAFIGVLCLLGCLYHYVSRRFGPAYGLISTLFVLCLPVRLFAIQARPYGIVLGLSGLLLLLYPAARGEYRFLAVPGLALCTAALTASHYYAILVVAVLTAAEFTRARTQKGMDWLVLAACTLPAAFVLWLLRSAIREQKAVLTHYFARGNLMSFNHGYDQLLLDPLVIAIAILLTTALLLLRIPVAEQPRLVNAAPGMPLEEWIFASGLLLLPIAGALLTQFVTHAYVPRYFLSAVIGLAICTCFVVKSLSATIPGLTLALVVSLTFGVAKATIQQIPRLDELPSASQVLAEDTPLLFDTPGTYTQAYYYWPSLRKNMWVIADPAASLHYRQYDTDDKIMLALASHSSAQTISLSDAVQKWPNFRLVPRSADYVWALKCLMETGSHIEVKSPFGPANFIFNVHVKTGSLPAINACAAH